jgi:hypothetical protein
MKDIRMHGDAELSLIVYNEPYFYYERNNREYLKALIDEEFEYRQEQIEELWSDLDLEDEK